MNKPSDSADVCEKAALIAKNVASDLRFPRSEVHAVTMTAIGVAAALEASKSKQK